MAVLYGTQSAKVLGPTPSTPSPGFVDGNVRVFVETITLATQTTADTIVVARIPKGAVFLGGHLLSTVSLGSATVAIGITGTPNKYRTAGTFTAVDTPTPFGNAAAVGVAEAAERSAIITIGAASLPASGTLVVMMFYATN
jgi:hypothetical protein